MMRLWNAAVKGIHISQQVEILCGLFILTSVSIFIMFTNSTHTVHIHQLMHRKHILKNRYLESNDSCNHTIDNITPLPENKSEDIKENFSVETRPPENAKHIASKSDPNLALSSFQREVNWRRNLIFNLEALRKLRPGQPVGNLVVPANFVPKPLLLNAMHNPIIMSTTQTPTMEHKQGPKYITVRFQGRLGNNMFQYASLIGIAQRNNLVAINNGDNHLNRVFKVKTVSWREYQSLPFTRTYEEKHGCTFENAVFNLGTSENVMLNGYYQSWKYFADPITFKRLKRQDFEFVDNLRIRATLQFFRIILPKVRNYDGKVIYIAVHIRRGDMVHREEYVRFGYTSPDIGYLNRAMEKFRSLYKNCLFVIASDDIGWCHQTITSDDAVFLPNGNPPELDMAILAQCDHTLMTVGSYGWWVAWLVGGTTIYYSGYPTPNSSLAEEFNSADYRPQSWIGMT